MPPHLPARGAAVRRLGLPLPPERMRPWLAGRPLKRWRYVGVYTPELMLCVGDVRIGPLPQRFWAVALPGGELRERTTLGAGGVELRRGALDGRGPGRGGGPTSGSGRAAGSAPAEPFGTGGPRPDRATRVRLRAGGVAIDLELAEGDGVETVSPVGERGAYMWTRKQAGVPARGAVTVDGAVHAIDAPAGFVDDSAGYHPRHTAWRWSAGVGRTEDGRPVGWNLVDGVHDAPEASERTLWLDGAPVELGPVRLADDLSSVAFADGSTLAFSPWSTREHATNALLVRSSYRQPFGTFSGALPGGLPLSTAHGVMEHHDVHW